MLFATELSLLDQMKSVGVEEFLLPLLIQLVVIIAAARLFAVLVRWLRQPAVIGEVLAGLLLGPTVFGRLFPTLFSAVFQPTIGDLPANASDLLLNRALTTLAQLGLVLLLFLIGLEFEFGHLRQHGKAAVGVAIAGLLLPFGLGCAMGSWLHPHFAEHVPWLAFTLFIATTVSITAIPMLGRIMLDLGITRTRTAVVTMSAAAAEDVVGWVLLAVVAALASSLRDGSSPDPWLAARMLGLTLVFAVTLLLARQLVVAFVRSSMRANNGDLSVNALAAVLVLLLMCAITTNVIGIFAVFGAFLLGAVLSDQHELRRALALKLRDLVTCFFLPVFFAYTGLRTRIDALNDWHFWGATIAVIAVVALGKLVGCGLAAWLCGLPWRESLCVGVMMNARGLMGLIVINVGKDLGVIPDSVYSMLVLMALVTTLMTTPLLLRAARGTELEECIQRSGFLRAPPSWTSAN